MDTYGFQSSTALLAAPLLVCSACLAVFPCCSAPCWPASCSGASPLTPLSKPWTLVGNLNGKINGENRLAETTVAVCVFNQYFLKMSKRPRHCPSLVKPRHCTIDSVDVWRTHTFLNPANPQFSLQVILSSPGSRSWSEFKAPSSCSPSICSLWVSSETLVPGKMLPKQTHPIRQRKVKFPRQSPPPQRKSQKTSHRTPWWKLVFKISDLKVIIHSFSLVIVVFLYQDIKRIAQSLLKAMKSPVPDMELRPGQQVDINTLLSLLEDIIRLQNWAAGDFYTDEIKKDHSKTVSLHSVNLQGSQDEVWDIWLVSY